MNHPTKNERDIQRIMKLGTAIGFGCMAASLAALHSSPTGISFQITGRTLFAFVLGAAAVFPFWKIVFNVVSGNRQRSRHVWAASLLLLIGIGAFLYPSRFVPAEKLRDMYTGLVIAACALSLLAAMLILFGKFFETDGEKIPKNPNTQPPKER
ncbi:MAG: hypothetical protein JWQ04_2672 [Pedosphaera sp.]|nr:hypothetical protein [Pedosphaera sp.]